MPLNPCANIILILHLSWRLKSCRCYCLFEWGDGLITAYSRDKNNYGAEGNIDLSRRELEKVPKGEEREHIHPGIHLQRSGCRTRKCVTCALCQSCCPWRWCEMKMTPFPFPHLATTHDERAGASVPPISRGDDIPASKKYHAITLLQRRAVFSRVFCHIPHWEEPIVMLDAHLSFTDDEEGVSSGSLSNDVLSIFVMCLSGEKATEECCECAPFLHPETNVLKKIRPSHSKQMLYWLYRQSHHWRSSANNQQLVELRLATLNKNIGANGKSASFQMKE